MMRMQKTGRSGLSGEPVLIWSTKRNTPPAVGTSKALCSRGGHARIGYVYLFRVDGDVEKRTTSSRKKDAGSTSTSSTSADDLLYVENISTISPKNNVIHNAHHPFSHLV